MMFGPVIGSVVGSWMPVVSELALGITTTESVEFHVHGFCVPGLDVVGDYAMSCAVVGLDWRGWLFVAHFFNDFLHWDCLAGIDVEGSKFGFSCTGHDCFEIFRYVEDGTVVGWIVNVG